LALSKTDVGTILLTHSTFYNFAHFALYNQWNHIPFQSIFLEEPYGTCGSVGLEYFPDVQYTYDRCKANEQTVKMEEVCGCRAPYMPGTHRPTLQDWRIMCISFYFERGGTLGLVLVVWLFFVVFYFAGVIFSLPFFFRECPYTHVYNFYILYLRSFLWVALQ
jgi:hypothetical protein